VPQSLHLPHGSVCSRPLLIYSFSNVSRRLCCSWNNSAKLLNKTHKRKRDLKYKCSMESVNGLLCKIFTLSEQKKYFPKLRLWYLDLTNESNYNFYCIQMNIVYVQIILKSQHCRIPASICYVSRCNLSLWHIRKFLAKVTCASNFRKKTWASDFYNCTMIHLKVETQKLQVKSGVSWALLYFECRFNLTTIMFFCDF